MAVAEGFEPYPGCWSRARKALYLRKHFTVTHTQTYILVGKCGQNVGTTLAGSDSPFDADQATYWQDAAAYTDTPNFQVSQHL
jgi:hypothetical protein